MRLLFVIEGLTMTATPHIYFSSARLRYKPMTSPDLWTHLENLFEGPNRIGACFAPLAGDSRDELLAQCEEALMEAFVVLHQKTKRIEKVSCTLEMPFVTGTCGMALPHTCDTDDFLHLIDNAGAPHERLIRVLCTKADALPITHTVTITGDLYGDGHTFGMTTLRAGNETTTTAASLATREQIRRVAYDMEEQKELIRIAPRAEIETMIIAALSR